MGLTPVWFCDRRDDLQGLVFPAHKNHLMGLPRLSLNGEFQDLQMLSVLLGGAPFALRNGFKHVAAA